MSLWYNVSMSKVAAPAHATHLVIKASTGWSGINLKELVQYKDLALVFAVRDIKLRYRQTLLGPIWIILQPLLGAGVMNFIFGSVAKLPTPKGVPSFVVCFTGQLGWMIFSGIVSKVSGSLVSNSHLVSKVYFPRLLLPLSTVFAVMVDFSASLLLLPVMMVGYHIAPSPAMLLLPVWILLLALLGLGVGLCAAALTVIFRDVTTVLNVVMGFLPYLSGVGFVVSSLPQKYRPIAVANPIAGLIEAFRWSLLGRGDFSAAHVVYAAVASVCMFVVGVFGFRRMERRFADVI